LRDNEKPPTDLVTVVGLEAEPSRYFANHVATAVMSLVVEAA
jgi:hypothetical protein